MQCCEVLEQMRENGIPTMCNVNSFLTLTLETKRNTKISANANELMDLTVKLFTDFYLLNEIRGNTSAESLNLRRVEICKNKNNPLRTRKNLLLSQSHISSLEKPI